MARQVLRLQSWKYLNVGVTTPMPTRPLAVPHHVHIQKSFQDRVPGYHKYMEIQSTGLSVISFTNKQLRDTFQSSKTIPAVLLVISPPLKRRCWGRKLGRVNIWPHADNPDKRDALLVKSDDQEKKHQLSKGIGIIKTTAYISLFKMQIDEGSRYLNYSHSFHFSSKSENILLTKAVWSFCISLVCLCPRVLAFLWKMKEIIIRVCWKQVNPMQGQSNVFLSWGHPRE